MLPAIAKAALKTMATTTIPPKPTASSNGKVDWEKIMRRIAKPVQEKLDEQVKDMHYRPRFRIYF